MKELCSFSVGVAALWSTDYVHLQACVFAVWTNNGKHNVHATRVHEQRRGFVLMAQHSSRYHEAFWNPPLQVILIGGVPEDIPVVVADLVSNLNSTHLLPAVADTEEVATPLYALVLLFLTVADEIGDTHGFTGPLGNAIWEKTIRMNDAHHLDHVLCVDLKSQCHLTEGRRVIRPSLQKSRAEFRRIHFPLRHGGVRHRPTSIIIENK